jgi:hypothetical protein
VRGFGGGQVVEAQEARVVEAAADEGTVVDARVVDGVLGKRALGITESNEGFTHILDMRVSASSQLRSA